MAVLNDMQLLVGPPEQQYISNAALMMFCEHLDKFFPYTQVEIVCFPGIDRSIPQRVIEEGARFSSKYYCNKCLGEFLKELDLSEGRSTGIPTIQE